MNISGCWIQYRTASPGTADIKTSNNFSELTFLSQDDTSKNWDEFGPNVTFEIPSSGGLFSLYSVLDSVILSEIE